MNNKWYISAFIFALAIIGISLEKVSVPNQEIVIQFTDVEVSPEETQDAIAVIKNQLQAIDVDNIQIQESGNGTLKITYYSDVEVSEIKEILSKGNTVTLGHTSYNNDTTGTPSEKDLTYEFDVYEIQESNDFIDTDGTIIESKSEIIRFFTPNAYVSSAKVDSKEENALEKLAYRIHRTIAIAINDAEYKIPEVRAGPLS